jgi:hypothetical protein
MSENNELQNNNLKDVQQNQVQDIQSQQQPQQPQQISIIDAFKMYINREPFKLYIGTPCYGGNLQIGYFQSLMETIKIFTALGVKHEVITIGSESLIPRARNGIVAKFMGDEEATHLLFIDADITFHWSSILKLVIMDKDVSGGCYPKKMVNWEKVKHNVNNDPNISEDLLMAKSLDYVFNPVYNQEKTPDGKVKLTASVSNGMVKVKDLGTGFMMIKKSVIEIMMYKYEDLKYRNNVAGYHTEAAADYFYTLFDTEIDPKSRVYLSEDYLFCKRWIECGGDCWLDITISLNHTGMMDYKGAISTSIGELDTLNKDFKTMQKQRLNDNKNNDNLQSNNNSNNIDNVNNTNTNDNVKKISI